MRPSREDKSKYVGIEIECYGPLSRSSITDLLTSETTLNGKVNVGTDRTIEPTQPRAVASSITPEEGALDIAVSEHRTRTLDLAESMYTDGEWVPYRLLTFRSRLRRQSILDSDVYWSNQDHELPVPTTVSLDSYEVRVLCKQSEITSIVKKMYKILTDAGCEVNNSCGLHVHLDMRYRNPMTSYHNLFKCQRMLLNLSSEDREDSTWCKPNTKSNLIDHLRSYYDDDGDLVEPDKYMIINPLSYNRLRTIEVRVGDGTMDYTRVVAWVDLLCTIVDDIDEMESQYTNIESFSEDYELTKEGSIDVLQEMDRAS